jgi:hypothetical protein
MALCALHVVWCLLSQGMVSVLSARIACDVLLAACLTTTTRPLFSGLPEEWEHSDLGCCWLFELHEWCLREIKQANCDEE